MLVAGGGLGGVAAALAAAERGARVVLSEETDWLGGQLTSQAVPPDEHPWIEDFGCTARYRALREAIRAHYRAHAPLTAAARARADLNPALGDGEPARDRAARRRSPAIEALLAPHRDGSRSCSSTRRSPPPPTATGSRAVTLRGPDGERVVEAGWFVDATETGELLPLAGAEHVTGAESREQTGEPHAAAVADPLDMQPVSRVLRASTTSTARTTRSRGRPATTRCARGSRCTAPDPRTNEPVARTLAPNPPGDPGADRPGPRRPFARQGAVAVPADRGPRELRPRPPAQRHHAGELAADRLRRRARCSACPDAERHRAAARELSLCFLHWLQTEAGFPGLRLRGDVVGDTPDGLAKALYIRESRRIARRARRCSSRSSARAYPDSRRDRRRTGSTCIPPPAATRTSTSPARRSGSRSAR